MEEIDFVADELKKIIGRLRDMSPLYEDFLKKKSSGAFCDRLEGYYVQ